ncbi:MAG: hypothetical protein Q8P23_03765 [bacterium]|nr:hypothetical protein [bacterium]
MNTKILGGIVTALVIAGGSFYGGMAYAKSTTPSRGQFTANGQFAGAAGANRTGMRTGGFTAGQILSKDATGITIKMQDGSTKIILIGSSTQIMKTTDGSQDDLSTGTEVTVTGSANSDGSITAQSVQIRPAGSMSFGSTTQTTR